PLELAEALAPWTQTPIPPPPEAEMPRWGPGGASDITVRTGRGSSRIRGNGASAMGGLSTDTPRTAVASLPGETRILRSPESDPLLTMLAGDYVSPDMIRDQRYRVLVSIATACVITVLAYTGIIIWTLVRNSAAHTEAKGERPKTLPAAVGE